MERFPTDSTIEKEASKNKNPNDRFDLSDPSSVADADWSVLLSSSHEPVGGSDTLQNTGDIPEQGNPDFIGIGRYLGILEDDLEEKDDASEVPPLPPVPPVQVTLQPSHQTVPDGIFSSVWELHNIINPLSQPSLSQLVAPLPQQTYSPGLGLTPDGFLMNDGMVCQPPPGLLFPDGFPAQDMTWPQQNIQDPPNEMRPMQNKMVFQQQPSDFNNQYSSDIQYPPYQMIPNLLVQGGQPNSVPGLGYGPWAGGVIRQNSLNAAKYQTAVLMSQRFGVHGVPFQNIGGQGLPFQNTGAQGEPFLNTGAEGGPFSNTGPQGGPFQNTGGQRRVFQTASGQAGPSQNTGGQRRLFQTASGQAGPSQNIGGQRSLFQTASGQAGPSQNTGGQRRVFQTASGQAGPSQNTGGQRRVFQTASGQAGPSQNIGGQRRVFQTAGGQAGPSHNIGGQRRVFQTASEQAGPSQNIGGQRRVFQTAGGQAGPSHNIGGQRRVFQTASGQAGPSQNIGGQSRAFQTASGQAGPSQNIGGQRRIFQTASGQAGPSQNIGGQRPRFQGDQRFPFQGGQETGAQIVRSGTPAQTAGGQGPWQYVPLANASNNESSQQCFNRGGAPTGHGRGLGRRSRYRGRGGRFPRGGN